MNDIDIYNSHPELTLSHLIGLGSPQTHVGDRPATFRVIRRANEEIREIEFPEGVGRVDILTLIDWTA